jgi:hypothetical protein
VGAYVLGVGFGFFSGTEKNKEGKRRKPAWMLGRIFRSRTLKAQTSEFQSSKNS